jgi:glycosyltransferase involved in cell wall biosynthesis
MKVAILYYNFLDSNGSERKIGGVETYLWNLAKLIFERGDEPVLLQPATRVFEKKIGHLKIIGVPPNRRRWRKHTRKDLYERALSLVADSGGLIVFGADQVSTKTDYPRAVVIQHGIGWDLPARFLRGRLGKIPLIPDFVCKRYNAYRSLLYFNNCPNRVCVDYNFLNWYRTQIADVPEGKIWVIPNFVDIPTDFRPNLVRHKETLVRILFARRFVEYRGSRLMIAAARQLFRKFEKIEVCFAGEGPDQQLIADTFADEPRVSIRKYLPDEALQIHEQYQIAVVPSLASEGTSLSLAEGMAAGCAVVATNVGGMTNMVIDGYNGRLINPCTEDLVKVLSELIADSEMRFTLGSRAADTAREAFSLARWKSHWSEVLNEVQGIR